MAVNVNKQRDGKKKKKSGEKKKHGLKGIKGEYHKPNHDRDSIDTISDTLNTTQLTPTLI